MKEYPWGKGTPKWVRDAALNDSDKTFTVPAGKVWLMRAIYNKLVTTATVGNRLLSVMFAPDGTNAETWFSGPNHAASTTQRYRMSFEGVTDDIVVNDGGVIMGFPVMVLPAGATIRIYDSAAIDAAADDLTVVLHYVEYDA